MKKTLRFALLTAIVSAFSVGGVKAQTTTPTYKSDFKDGQVLTLTTTDVTNYVKAGWVTMTGSLSSKSLSNKTGIDPTDDTSKAKAVNGSYYVVKGLDSKDLKLYVTGISKITVYAYSNSSSARNLGIDVNGTKNDKAYEFSAAGAGSATVTLNPSANNIVSIYGSNEIEPYAIKVDVPAADEPTFSASPTSLDLNVTAEANPATGTFTLVGKNLTNGTYNLTVPSIAGLTVTPTSFTVAEGAVNQEFTVSYTSDENVKLASDTIKANVDNLNAAIAINYSALVKAHEQETISESTTWDFSKSGISSQVPFDDGDIVLANVTGVVNSADFNSQALVVNGQRIDKGYIQANTVKIKTSVPGKIQVVVGGTNGNTRKLEVNGIITEDSVNSTKSITSKEYAVPTGDIILRGYDVAGATYNNFRWYKIIFTADQVTEAGTVTIKANFQRTSFSSDKAIDFSKTEGLTAYVVTDANGKVEAVTSVPANTGVIVERAAATAEAQTFTLYEAADAAAPAANFLFAASATPTTDGASIYGYGRKNGVEGFYLYKSGLTPTSGKAYLVLPPSSEAKEFISFGGNNGQTDAINAVIAEQNAENANIYNLAGQQVNKAYKGVVVVNGKKYIQK